MPSSKYLDTQYAIDNATTCWGMNGLCHTPENFEDNELDSLTRQFCRDTWRETHAPSLAGRCILIEKMRQDGVLSSDSQQVTTYIKSELGLNEATPIYSALELEFKNA